MIAKRLVFVFPGFEPMRAIQHARRFRRQATATAAIYGAHLRLGEATKSAEDAGSGAVDCPAELSGEGYRTRTQVVFFDWGDIILSYAARPAVVRVANGLWGLADIVATGTIARYARLSWRYVFFVAFPLLVLIGAGLAGWAGYALVQWLAGPQTVTPVGLAVAALVALAVVALADRRLHFLTACDDWALARDLCRERNGRLTRRIAAQAEALARRMARSDADEIVVAAHSLGACLAVEALDKALAMECRPRRKPVILTVGSSLMKTALHPAAKRQKAAVGRLVGTHDLVWIDCQSLTDIINFYKTNPARSLGIAGGRTPQIVRVRFKHMLTKTTYDQAKRDFFRIHRQFVFAPEKRASYAFHLLCLGPNPVAEYGDHGSVDRAPFAASAPRAAGGAA